MTMSKFEEIKTRIERNLNKEIEFNSEFISQFSDLENLDDFDTELIIVAYLTNNKPEYFLQGVMVKDEGGNAVNYIEQVESFTQKSCNPTEIAYNAIESYSSTRYFKENNKVKLTNDISEIESIGKTKISFFIVDWTRERFKIVCSDNEIQFKNEYLKYLELEFSHNIPSGIGIYIEEFKHNFENIEVRNLLLNSIPVIAKEDIDEVKNILISSNVELSSNDRSLIEKIWELGREFKILYYIDEITKEKIDPSSIEENMIDFRSKDGKEHNLFIQTSELLYYKGKITYRIGGYVC